MSIKLKPCVGGEDAIVCCFGSQLGRNPINKFKIDVKVGFVWGNLWRNKVRVNMAWLPHWETTCSKTSWKSLNRGLMPLWLFLCHKKGSLFLWCCHPLKGNNLGTQVLQNELPKSCGYCGWLGRHVSHTTVFVFTLLYKHSLNRRGFFSSWRCPWKGCQWLGSAAYWATKTASNWVTVKD